MNSKRLLMLMLIIGSGVISVNEVLAENTQMAEVEYVTNRTPEENELLINEQQSAGYEEKIKHNELRDAKGTWMQSSDGGWWFKYNDGHYAVAWDKIDGTWYYFDKNGWMKSNEWIIPDGKWYYLSGSGAMVTGNYNINGIDYNFSSNGNLLHAGDLQVAIFGKRYTDKENDINTNTDVDIVNRVFNNSGYDILTCKNFSKSDFYKLNYVGESLINSGVFVYSGHGAKSGALALGNYQYLRPNDLPVMNNTKVALLFACYGGKQGGIAQATVNKGAKASYGYKGISKVGEDRTIMKNLIRSMLKGQSLQEATNNIKSTYPTMSVVSKNYIVLYGDTNTKLSNYKIKREANILLNDILSKEDLKSYRINEHVGHKYYRDILTTDSFALKQDNETLICYYIDLTTAMLNRLDPVIDKVGKGEMYDNTIVEMLEDKEKIYDVFTVIAPYKDQARMLRKYYISDEDASIINEIKYIDVETGELLTEDEGNKILMERRDER